MCGLFDSFWIIIEIGSIFSQIRPVCSANGSWFPNLANSTKIISTNDVFGAADLSSYPHTMHLQQTVHIFCFHHSFAIVSSLSLSLYIYIYVYHFYCSQIIITTIKVKHNEVHCSHRRSRLWPRKRRDHLVHGPDAPGLRFARHLHQDRPLPQCRRRDHESLRTWRNLRPRRWW